MRLLVAFLIITLSSIAFAQEETMMEPPASTQELAADHEDAHADAHHVGPVLPDDTRWAGVMVIVIAGLFVAAAVVGPVVRANAPEEVPPAHAHDEPPGSSHHHGKSGLVNPEPDHGSHGHSHGGHH